MPEPPVDRHLPWIPGNFLALPPEQSEPERAGVRLIPIPYDSTTSFRSGAREGPAAILAASYGLEDYDWELDLDVSQIGIYTAPALEPHTGDPAQMAARVQAAVGQHIAPDRLVGVIGGEHSLCIGAARAHLAVWPNLSVLYLDAHADLRDEYLGTAWGHSSGRGACMSIAPSPWPASAVCVPEERDYQRQHNIPTFAWPPPAGKSRADWRAES